MKYCLAVLLSLISLSSFAKCDFYLEKDSIVWAGLTLNFGRGLTDIMEEKGYSRVYRQDLSNTNVLVNITTRDERFFQHAVAEFIIEGESFSHDVRCFTQNCAISDLAKATNKAMRKVKKKLKACSL